MTYAEAVVAIPEADEFAEDWWADIVSTSHGLDVDCTDFANYNNDTLVALYLDGSWIEAYGPTFVAHGAKAGQSIICGGKYYAHWDGLRWTGHCMYVATFALMDAMGHELTALLADVSWSNGAAELDIEWIDPVTGIKHQNIESVINGYMSVETTLLLKELIADIKNDDMLITKLRDVNEFITYKHN